MLSADIRQRVPLFPPSSSSIPMFVSARLISMFSTFSCPQLAPGVERAHTNEVTFSALYAGGRRKNKEEINHSSLARPSSSSFFLFFGGRAGIVLFNHRQPRCERPTATDLNRETGTVLFFPHPDNYFTQPHRFCLCWTLAREN